MSNIYVCIITTLSGDFKMFAPGYLTAQAVQVKLAFVC